MSYVNAAPTYSNSGGSRPHAPSGNRTRTDNRAYSRYGHLGKGLTDAGARRYAAGLTGQAFIDYTTFIEPSTGNRKAKGFMQVMGHTAASILSGSPAPYSPIKAPVNTSGQGLLAPSGGLFGWLGGAPNTARAPSGISPGFGKPLGLPPAEEGGLGILPIALSMIVLKVLL